MSPAKTASLSEDQGKRLLEARFTEAGYAMVRDFPFHEGDIEVDLDGWDAEARVGFEYITREAGDHLQFDEATLLRLERRMESGELAVLLVDEGEGTEEELEAAAACFLEQVAENRRGGP
jgi:hypothetical protein